MKEVQFEIVILGNRLPLWFPLGYGHNFKEKATFSFVLLKDGVKVSPISGTLIHIDRDTMPITARYLIAVCMHDDHDFSDGPEMLFGAAVYEEEEQIGTVFFVGTPRSYMRTEHETLGKIDSFKRTASDYDPKEPMYEMSRERIREKRMKLLRNQKALNKVYPVLLIAIGVLGVLAIVQGHYMLLFPQGVVGLFVMIFWCLGISNADTLEKQIG